MARIELMPGIQSISGTIGNLTFRTRGGKTFVHANPAPELPKQATLQEREKWLRTTVLNQCVKLIQDTYENMYDAIRQRTLIRQRLAVLYAKHRAETAASTKLRKKLLDDYRRLYRHE